MPYKYAIVCGFDASSYTKGHSGILLVESEKPIDKFPYAYTFTYNYQKRKPTLDTCKQYTTYSTYIQTKNRLYFYDIRDKSLSELPIKTSDRRAINELRQQVERRSSNVLYDDEVQQIKEYVNFDPYLQAGCTTTYISITQSSAIKSMEFEKDINDFKKLPNEYVIIPESVDGLPGINCDNVKKWWEVHSKERDAFIFRTESYDEKQNYFTNTEPLELTESGKKDISNLFSSNEKEAEYVIFKRQNNQLVLAYKDNQKNPQIKPLDKHQTNELNQCLYNHPTIKREYNWKENTGKLCRDINSRKLIQNIAEKLVNHSPPKLSEFDRLKNNCSHIVRGALAAGGIAGIKAFFSSPKGVIQDSISLANQINKNCSITLKEFIVDTITELEKTESKYKTRDVPTSKKLEEFKKLKIKLETDSSSVTLQHVEDASKLHRGLALGDSKTFSEFKKFKQQFTALRTKTPGDKQEKTADEEYLGRKASINSSQR